MGDRRGWIGVDLDGTIAYYDGWKGETHIGAPIPGMVSIVRRVLEEGDMDVRIFTARVASNDPEEVAAVTNAIQAWCREHIGQSLEVTCRKDYQMVALYDDRAIQVLPNSGELLMHHYDRALERLTALGDE